MADIAHKQTDKLISELDEKLKMVYALANQEIQEKADNYFKRFEAKDKIKQAQVASGKITDKEYKEWRKGQILIGDKWKEMRETLASDMTNTNKIAVDIINGHSPTAYALNHNYSTFQVERDSLTDTSFTLYSHESVEKLIKDNPDILPKWKIDKAKDYQWNYKKVNSITTQAILQGESIPEISKKLASNLCTQNNNLMNTFARTAITGAQNSGRMDAYHRAKDMGISMKKVWLATLDGRTRHSHRMLDGQKVDIDEKFDNKCLFPGDPSGPASEVYNCRCTLLSQPTGVDYKVSDLTKRNEKLGVMSYEAWQKRQKGFEAMPDSMIANTWSGKKYGHVYNLMKNSNIAGHGADANNFFYALKEIGQETSIGNPPKVWVSYLAGDLDDDQIAKFENIIKKYLPKLADDTVTDTFEAYKKSLPVKWSELFDQDEELAQELFSNVSKMDAKYWQKYITGEITDADVDDVLKAHFAKNNGEDFISDKVKDIESKIKWEKAEPMTFKQADDHKVNPLYSKGYENSTTNCQTSTFVYECRRQGYDVVALPRNLDDDIEKLQKELSYDTRKCWLTKDKGEKPEFLIKNANGTEDDIYSLLEKKIGTNGERYTFEFEWSTTESGHIINLDRDENGVLRLIDNQRGKLEKHIWTGEKEIKEYISSGIKNVSVTRVDNCVPNPEFFNSIVQKADNIKDSRTWVQLGLLKGDEISDLLDLDMEDAEKFYNQWRCGLKESKILDDFMKKDALEVEAKKIAKAESKSKAAGEIQAILEKYGDYKTFVSEGEFMDHKKLAAFFKEDGVNANDAIKAAFNELENNKVAKDVAAEVESVFGNKSMSAVYKGIQNIYGNTEGNVFYYKVLQPIGKPSDVWKKYIANELDPLDAANIDDFLLAHIEVIDKIDDMTDIAKIKANLPNFGDLDDDIYDKLWEAIVNKKGDTPFDTYWEKYLADEIKDKELDDILKVSKYASNVPDLANKADEITKASKTLSDINKAQNELDMDIINSKSVSAVWKELNQAKAGGGKFWSDVTEIGKKYDEKPSGLWKKYLAGELDTDDATKIETHLAKLYKKADDVTDDIIDDIKKTLPKGFADMDDTMSHDVIEIITPKAPGIKGPSQYYKKWLNNEIMDADLDNYFKVPTVTPKPVTSETINVLEAVKNKKVSTIWNQLKDEGGTTYSQWWKIVGDIGKSYDKKQSATWDLYLEGKLKDDEKEKIENFLLKHYLKKSDDVIDYSEFGGKEVYDTLKKYSAADEFFFYAPADEYDKITKIFHDNSDELQAAIDKIKKLEKAKTAAKTVEAKSDDLIKAEKKLNDLQDKLQKYEWYNNKIDIQGEVLEFTKDSKKVYAYSIDKGNDLLKQGAIPSNKFTEDFAKSLKGVKQDDLLNDIDDVKKKIVDLSSNKSDELVKAEEKLKKAEDTLKTATKELKDKVDNKETWVGLWKEPVTLDDYAEKKDKIAAKKIYFETEIDKLTNDPNYKSWLSDDAKDWQINDCKKKLKVLADYEKAGKKAEKYYDAVAEAEEAVQKAQQEVVKNTPVSEAFSQARKDAAIWGKNKTSDYERVDKIFDPHAREVHATRTAKETAAYMDYTSASGPYNKPLVGFDSPDGTGSDGWTTKYWVGPGKVDIDKRGRGDKIRALTTLIEKSTYDFDFWMQSSQNFATLEGKEGFLGIPYGALQNMNDSELQKFIGTTAELPQFISGAINKGGGRYNPGSMRLNIYVPKGSEALYVLEDGTFEKHEHEIILQRGGTYRITNMYWGYDDLNKERCLFVDMELHPEMGYDKFQQTKSK